MLGDCCQSEYRKVAFGLATWTHIESRVTLLVPIGVPRHMLEQTKMDVHNECPNNTPYEQRVLGLSVDDETQRTPRVPHGMLFLNLLSFFSLNNGIPLARGRTLQQPPRKPYEFSFQSPA